MASSARAPLDLIADYVEARARLRESKATQEEQDAKLDPIASGYLNALLKLQDVIDDPYR